MMNADLRLISHLIRYMRICLILFICTLFMALPSYADDITVQNIGDYGNVTVMEVTGNYDAKINATVNQLPRQLISKEFFKTHKDEYDFLVIFTNFDFVMPEAEAWAFYLGVRNDIHGIGQQVFDNSSYYGSNGKLQGTIDMGNLAGKVSDPLDPKFEYTIDTLNHEMLHRWASFVKFKDASGNVSSALIGKDGAHWSFLLDTKASLEYGNQWQDNGNGTFTSIAARQYFSPLDLYLMGMNDKSKVPPMLLIDSPSIDPARMPEVGATISGTARYVTIDDIIAAEGERVPGVDQSQKKFKTAFIFITRPSTYKGDELPGIENIRNGFLSRYSILTDGQGLVQVASTPKDDIPINPGVKPVTVVPRTLPPTVNEGVQWLINHQQTDGSWSETSQTTERDTAESVATLQIFPVANQQFQTGLTWLNQAVSANTDYLARRIEAITTAGGDASVLVKELVSRQNNDGGWGSSRNFVSSPTDTGLALRVLAIAKYADQQVIGKGIDYLKSSQNQDGGWSGDRMDSLIQPTAAVLSAFNAYRNNYVVADQISRGTVWLQGKQNGDGGFGNSPSTVYDSSVAIMALRETGASTDITDRGVNYLLSLQTGDGSWNESPFQTALAVKSVWKATETPDLSIQPSDISIIPASLKTIPTNAVLNATIWNLGRTGVPQAKVALYDGAISETTKIGEQILAFPGSSQVTVTFPILVTDGNEHVYNVVIDPDNLVKESNKNNNIAYKTLIPDSTYDFEVLAADLSVAPNPGNMFQDVTIQAKIYNHGTSNAYSVPVRFFIDSTTPTEIATVAVDIPAGGSIAKAITWKASKAGVNMPLSVMIDPLNTFTETNKTNNLAVVPLTINGSTLPNLMVSFKDVVITPSIANQGGNANISVQVKNGGFVPATNVKVNFYNGVPDHNGVLLGSQTVTAVNPGESATASIDWINIGESGEKIIYVRVDPDNAIPEITKDDNDTFTTLRVLNLPDLVISSSSIVLTPAVPKDGDNVSIAVTVQNIGEQDAVNVAVQTTEGNTVLGSTILPIVKGHSQATASIPYNATGKIGSHTIIVVVDPDSKILEQSKDNNTAIKTFGVQNANLWLSEPYFSPNGDGIKDTTDFTFRLDSPTAAKVLIVDKNGNTVKTFSGGDLDNTQGGIVTWDGMNDNGMVVGDGAYQFKLVNNNNIVLGNLSVVVDVNRSPISDAIGTKFSQKTNLTCGLPQIQDWKWLPDESGILFYVQNGNTEYPRGLYLMSPDGTNIVNLLPQEWNSDPLYSYSYGNVLSDFYVSSDGEKIVFTLNRTYKDRNAASFVDGQQLIAIDVATNSMTTIDSNDILWQQTTGYCMSFWGPYLCTYPTIVQDYYTIQDFDWSPDGSKLMYQKRFQSINNNNSHNGEITSWLYDTISSNKKLILTTASLTNHFWSPDGANLVYTTDNSDLWLANINNGTTIKVDSNISFYNLAWTDNGSKFAYGTFSNTNNGTNYLIKVCENNGSVRNVYTSQSAGANPNLQWRGPNLQWLANDKLVLTENEYQMNGNWYVIQATREFLIDSNGNGTVTKLEEVCRGWFGTCGWFDGPYVSPDKQKIAFVVSEDGGYTSTLKIADLTGNVSTLYNLKKYDGEPGWFPEFDSLTWSPDSNRIAFFIWGYYGWDDWAGYGPIETTVNIVTSRVNTYDNIFPYPDINAGKVIKWLPDSVSFIGSFISPYASWGPNQLYSFNTDTGGITMLAEGPGSFNGWNSISALNVSPFDTYISYYDATTSDNVCNGQNLWQISFFNNLTAELRIAKTNSAVTLKGVAQDLNFDGYKLEYADVKNPGVWNLVAPPSDVPVVNDVFTVWFPPYDGSFYVKLTVWDKAGNTASSKRRISWGDSSSSITSIYKTTDFISPNGDGIKDNVELHYRILAPVHIEFNVYDEDNNIVKSFLRDYALPGDNYISWDGTDMAGNVVPDGKYVIKVLDYEFFVEVDNTPPDAALSLSNIKSDPISGYIYVELTALANDKNIKSWLVEYADASTPDQWNEYKKGEDNFVKRDENKTVIQPVTSDTLDSFWNENISFLKGKLFRITVEDYAGNRSTKVANPFPEVVTLYAWGDKNRDREGYAFTTTVVPSVKIVNPDFSILGVATLKTPIKSAMLQYWNGTNWLDLSTMTSTSGTLQGHIDAASMNLLKDGYAVRAKLQDSFGVDHFSNALEIKRMLNLKNVCDGQTIPNPFQVINTIYEPLTALKIFAQSSDDHNYTTAKPIVELDIAKGDDLSRGVHGDYIGPSFDHHYILQAIGYGASGRSYYSDLLPYPGCKAPIEDDTLFGLGIDYDQNGACDKTASGKVNLGVVISATYIKPLLLQYFIQKPTGLELLKSIDLTKQSVEGVIVDASTLAEGVYPVKAVLTYYHIKKLVTEEIMAQGNLIVDRVLPTAQLTYPTGNTLGLCPIKLSDWFGIPIEGIALDNTGVKQFDLYYGVGDNPSAWLPAMTGDKVFSGKGSVKGRLGVWNITGLPANTYTLKLKVTDVVGNVSCATSTITIDDTISVSPRIVDKPLFSPNGDGISDTVSVTYNINKYATVDVKVFKLIESLNHWFVLDSLPVRTIVTGFQHLSGSEITEWNGKNDSGLTVPDGRYGIAVFATDSCGNTTSNWTAVEVDNTAPTVVISYPTPAGPLLPGNIIEIKGSAIDPHFKSYTVEAGEGDNPTSWAKLTTNNISVNNGILSTWNTFGLQGRWTLRLTAEDTVGNKNSTTSTIDLGARKTLIKSYDAVPKLISPNNDGKVDNSSISYETTDLCDIKIEVINTAGIVVKTTASNTLTAGTHALIWNGTNDAGVTVPDGVYSLRLTAQLQSNPSISQVETLSVIVDDTLPVISIPEPADSAYLNKTSIALVGSITDQNILNYTVSYAGPGVSGILETGNVNRANYTFGTINDLAEGTYTITAVAKDQGENEQKVTKIFTIDRTAPKVTLDTPKNNEYYGATHNVINIAGAVVEKNLDKYSLRYGVGEAPTQWQEVVGGNTVPVTPQLYSWKVGKDDGVADGVYIISLYAKDKAGLEGETRSRIVIDNTPPLVAITSPKTGDYVKAAFDIKGTAFDVNLDKALLEIAEGSCAGAVKWTPIKALTAPIQDSVLTSWQMLPDDGDYCLRLSAVDKVGQTAETKVSIKVNVHPPAAPVLNGTVQNKIDANLAWTQNTKSDFAGYNIYRNGQKLNTALLSAIQYIDSSLIEGNYTYTVTAVDLSGNESAPSNSVKLRIDLTGPTVRFSSPRDGAMVSSLVDIKGTAYSSDDFKQYRVSIGQGPSPTSWNLIRTSPIPVSSGLLAQWDTIGLAECVYAIKLEGEDLSGNISSQQITVTIHNTPPSKPQLVSALPTLSDVAVTWQANTDTVVGYLLFRNDQLANATKFVIGNITPYQITGTSYLDKSLPDGTYRYNLVAVDQAGNFSTQSDPLTVTIDTHPPHATITEPADKTKIEAKTLVSATSVDNDIKQIQFQYKKPQDVAWTNIGAPVTMAPYVTYFDPKGLGLSYGDYQLMAVATDNGNKIDPAPTAITVTYTDLTPPAVPANLNAITNGSNVTLSWSANTTDSDLNGYNIYRTSDTTTTKINSTLIKNASYQDSNLADGLYTYAITAIDTFGNESKPSTSVSATIYAPLLTQPYTPVGLPTASVVGANAAPNSSVELFRNTISDQISLGKVIADPQGNFVFNNVSLIAGENSLTAKAVDNGGNTSRASDAVVVLYSLPPSQPQGLATTVQDYSVSLSWNQNMEADLAGYNIFRDGTKLNVAQPVITGQTSASSYSSDYYKPSNAFDGNLATAWLSDFQFNAIPVWWEEDFSSPKLINHLEIHWLHDDTTTYSGKDFEVQAWSGYAWITLAKVSGNGSNDNTFDFKPSYPTEKIRIKIINLNYPGSYKRVGISEVNILQDGLVSQTAYQDMNLRDGKYGYTVTAVNSSGLESMPSDKVSADVGDVIPPAAPQGLNASASGFSINLNWAQNSELDLAGYNVYRKSSDGWVKLTSQLVTTTLYTDQPLLNGTYVYRITAVDMVGNESSPSAEASATVAVIIGAPRNLHVTPASGGKALDLGWDTPAGITANYAVYRSLSSGGPYNKVSKAPLSGLSYEDAGLINGTTYYYVVTALDSAGNESIYSNEAFGVLPSITLGRPILLSPTVPGVPITLFTPSTDIAGMAESGSLVELFRNSLSVGSVTTSVEDVVAPMNLPQGASYPTYTPDNGRIAYYLNSALWIKDLATGETVQVITPSGDRVSGWYPPAISPDGSKILFEYLVSGRWRLAMYDRNTGMATPFTDDANPYEWSAVWFRDGKRIAFVSDRSGSSSIWIKDMETGSLTLFAEGNNPDYLAISPDNKNIANFEYPDSGGMYLVVKDLETGTTLQRINDTDGYSVSWSPDSRRVAYIYWTTQGTSPVGELMTYDLDTQEIRQVTASGTNKWSPAWSPDGKQIALAEYWRDKPNVLWIVDLNGNARMVRDDLTNIWSLYWRASGELLCSTNTLSYSVTPVGTFKVIGVGLQPGDNSFTAIAKDTTGNASLPSDAISVVFDESHLPDLSVTADDIVVFPPYPKPGEDVVMNAVVKNVTQNPVTNVQIDLYLWDVGGNLQLIKSEIVPQMGGNSEYTIATSINAGNQTGSQSVIVVVDPADTIKELLKTNNYASKDFYVTSLEGVAMATSLDAVQYTSNNIAAININLRNSGAAMDTVLNVSIEDLTGAVIKKYDTISATLPYGVNSINAFTWNTGATFAGNYQVHALLKDTSGNTISENTVPFAILPDLKVDLGIITDKAGYGAGENVVVDGSLTNVGSNYVIPQLKVKVRILDQNNAELFTEEKILQNLYPTMGSSVHTTWNTAFNMPGTYQAIIEVYVADQLLTSKAAAFKINPAVTLSGTVVATPSVALFGNAVKTDYTIRNSGNIAANGVVKVVVVDQETQTVVASNETAVPLAMNSSQAGEFSFSSVGLALKQYLVNLQYIDQNGTRSIASASFTVKDGIPPVVTPISPVPAGTYSSTVPISVLATDDASGVDKVEYQIDTGAWKPLPLVDSVKGSYVAAWQPAITDNGTHTIGFRATDRAGNTTTTVPISFIIQIDTTPPILTVSTLTDGTYTNQPLLNIAGTVTDDTGVKELLINGVNVPVNSDGSFSYALMMQSGANLVTVTAADLAGNQTTDPPRTINLDQTAPVLVVTKPADNSKTGNALADVTGTVDETSTVTVKINGSIQNAVMNGTAFTATVTLVSGLNTIEITATDLAGNQSTQKRTVLFDDQIPSLAVTDPNHDIRTNQSSITIKGTASDPLTAVTVSITMDGQTFTPPVVNGAFEQTVSFTTEKSYAIIVTATNEVGTATSVQRNIIYDITPPALTIDPVTSPTNQASQVVTGTMEAGAIVTVTCATATVGDVTYPTATTWSATAGGFTSDTNNIAAAASDAAGNVTNVTTQIIYDITPPTGSITINNGAIVTNAAQVQLTLSAADANGVTQMRLSSDGTNWTDPETYVTTRGWALVGGDGLKQVFAQFKDTAGNWSSVPIVAAITLDTIPPTVVATPSGGIYAKGQSVTLTANEAATIYYTTDGSLPTTASPVCTTAIVIPTTTTLKFFARDVAGNSGEVKTERYIIDTTPPVLIVSTLNDGTYTNQPLLNIAGTVTDDTGVKELLINGVNVPVNSDGSFSYALMMQSGANLVTVTAADLAGNQTTDPPRTINLDQTAPVLVVTKPADNSKTGNALADVTGTVDETSTVTVKINGSIQNAVMNGTAFTATVTLASGLNTIEITATDLAGNQSTQKRTVLFDDQKPSLAVTDPNQDIRTNQSSITIKGTASDPLTAVTVSITMDGQTFTPPVINGAFEQVVSFTTEKSYAIIVTATNEVGTAAASVQRNIIYDITPPALTIDPVTSPTNQASQVVTGTMEAGATVIVTCATATVGNVTYPTATTWSATAGSFTSDTNSIAAAASDAAGNVTNVTTQIIYDVTPPTGSITINNGAIVTNVAQVQLTLSAADANGVTQMRLSSDGTNWTDPETYATARGWALVGGDGLKQVFAQFKDTAGNWSSAPIVAAITLDTTPPVISAMPAGGLYDITQNVALSTNEPAIIYYTIDGSAPTTASAVYGQPLTIAASTTLNCLAIDSAGNRSTTTYSYVIDTIPPVLTVSALADGSYTNQGVLNIAGKVTDNIGVKQLQINGILVPINSDGSFSHAVTLQNGGNTITTVATDLAGNMATDTRTINLDLTAPVLVVTKPADNSKTGNALVDVTGTVDETSTVTVKINGSIQNAVMNGTAFTATVTLASGLNTIEVTATDLAGNQSTQKRTVLFDDQKPALAVTLPAQDISTNQSSITIKGTASDPLTAVTVSITMDGQTFTPPVVNGVFAQTVSFTTEKSYAITVTATNEVGTATSVQRNIVYDITPPSLTINSVTTPTTQASQVISGTRGAGNTVTVTCATATVGGVTYPTTGTWSTSITNMQAGDNTIVASSSDAAGNVATVSAIINFETTPPETTFTFAVFGNKSVVMSGSFTDSYTGNPANHILGQYVNGDVGTNSSQSCSIQMSGGTEIFGKAWVGVGGNPATGVCKSGGSLVYNDITGNLTAAKDMTPKADPGGGTLMGALNVSGGATKTLSAGNYRFTSISLSGGSSTLTIDGQVMLHIDGNLTLSGGSRIIVTTGPVTIYVNGQKMDISGGSLINNSQIPKNLTIYGTAGLQTANLSGGSSQYALVYAPTAAITLSGGQNTFGSVIGSTVNLSGGSSVHFDESLKN